MKPSKKATKFVLITFALFLLGFALIALTGGGCAHIKDVKITKVEVSADLGLTVPVPEGWTAANRTADATKDIIRLGVAYDDEEKSGVAITCKGGGQYEMKKLEDYAVHIQNQSKLCYGFTVKNEKSVCYPYDIIRNVEIAVGPNGKSLSLRFQPWIKWDDGTSDELVIHQDVVITPQGRAIVFIGTWSVLVDKEAAPGYRALVEGTTCKY